jgi:glycosyltransferase involved in cell wall biosynthesis
MALLSTVVALVGLAYWGFQLLTILRVVRLVPRLDRLPLGARDVWPRISVILPACNEGASLEAAVRARLRDDYPDLELILVEDRSTDRTPEIADRLAAADPRLKVLHLTQLPEGWLGKLNALQQGLAVATGDWLLFSDGDVAVHDGVLRRVVHHCEERGLDHCVVLPTLRPVNPLLDCMTSIFLRMVTLNLRIWAIEDPGSRASVGVGAFNFVRRTAFERTPGFAWLRLEVADDIALGQMLKATGARQTVLDGRALVELRFHSSVADSLRSAERATYTAIGNFSLARLCALALASLALEMAPLWSLLLARTPANVALAAGLALVAIVAMVVNNRWLGRGSWNLLLFPVAELVIAYSTVRCGVLGAARGGIVWRGTFYPNAQLRAGRRFGAAPESVPQKSTTPGPGR